MEQIKQTIEKLLGELEAKNKGASSDGAGDLLKKVLAKKALGHVKLYNFRNGLLSVKVDSSTWLYYLSLQKKELLEKLQRLNDKIRDIRFSLGE